MKKMQPAEPMPFRFSVLILDSSGDLQKSLDSIAAQNCGMTEIFCLTQNPPPPLLPFHFLF